MGFELEQIVGNIKRLGLVGTLALSTTLLSENAQFTNTLFAQPGQQQKQADKTQIPVISPEKEVELRKLYAKELSTKDKESFNKLLKDALDTKDDPSTQFTLFNYAFNKATELYAFTDAFKVVDELDKRYSDINPTGMKLRTLDDARKKKPKGDQLESLVNGDMDFAIFEMSLGQTNTSHYELAATAAKNASEGAKTLKSKPLEDKAGAVHKYAGDLHKNKDDAFTQAKFKYFVLGDSSEDVLKVLSNGPDAKLKKLTGLQFIGIKDAGNYHEQGDVAYDAANESSRLPFEKFSLQSIALNLYNLVTSTATGAEKTKYERDEKLKKRKTELEMKVAQYGAIVGSIDLLAMIDPTKDKLSGDWKIENGRLTIDGGNFSRIEIPYEPPAEYDYTIVFSKKKGKTDVAQLLTYSGKAFSYNLDAGADGSHSGFFSAKQATVTAIPPSIVKRTSLATNKVYTSVVKIRKDGHSAYLDGEFIAKWQPTLDDLGANSAWALRKENVLGIGANNNTIEFYKITINEVSGKGKRLR